MNMNNSWNIHMLYTCTGMISADFDKIDQYIDLGQPKSVAPGPDCSKPD